MRRLVVWLVLGSVCCATFAHAQRRIDLGQTCDGKRAGADCWLRLGDEPGWVRPANQAECYVWRTGFQLGESGTWTGECADNVAQGQGTLTWSDGYVGNGSYRQRQERRKLGRAL